jgi:hypothetical protein
VDLAVEGCTGWRYVIEEIAAAGFTGHLAEPADTMAARGRKRHAKTDRSDSGLLRDLLQAGGSARVLIPPEAVIGVAGAGSALSLVDQRTPVGAGHSRRAL